MERPHSRIAIALFVAWLSITSSIATGSTSSAAPPSGSFPVPTEASGQLALAVLPVRSFRSAVVVLSSPGQDPTQLAQLRQLVSGVAALFPSYWLAATEGLSTMEMAPPEEMLDNGTLVTETPLSDRSAITAFYSTHADNYDFIAFFKVRTGYSFHSNAREDEAGTGLAVQGPGQFAGADRLLGTQAIAVDPASINSDPSGFMPVMLHEYHHQWCCYVKLPASSGLPADALLTPDQAHWSNRVLFAAQPDYPIVGGSVLGGWTSNLDGTYSNACSFPPIVPGAYRFPKLGLYLMGLISADAVPPIEVLTNPAIPTTTTGLIQCSTYSSQKVAVPISSIIATNGYSTRLPPPLPTTLGFAAHSRLWAQGPYLNLAQGQSQWAWIAFRNVGTTAWVRGTSTEIHLGINGDDRSFYNAGLARGWASPDRLALQQEAAVYPGQVTTFGFQVNGATPGTYVLNLRPVIDGLTWLEDEGIFFVVNVAQPYHSKWIDQSAYPTLAIGEVTTATVHFRNIGTSTWVKGTSTEAHLGINLDDQTISNLGMAVGWPFSNRPAIQAETVVAPGQIATFTFGIKGTRSGLYQLHLRPVIDGATWMEDEGVFFTITVH